MALSERTTRIYIKSPERKWLCLGGVAACALPVILGVLMLLPFSWPDIFDVIMLQTGITFVFGSLFASLLGCWRVKRRANAGFSVNTLFGALALGLPRGLILPR